MFCLNTAVLIQMLIDRDKLRPIGLRIRVPLRDLRVRLCVDTEDTLVADYDDVADIRGASDLHETWPDGDHGCGRLSVGRRIPVFARMNAFISGVVFAKVLRERPWPGRVPRHTHLSGRISAISERLLPCRVANRSRLEER